jgi:hypothetical protein
MWGKCMQLRLGTIPIRIMSVGRLMTWSKFPCGGDGSNDYIVCSCNLHDKHNQCFAACYKCLHEPWSDSGRKTYASFHAVFPPPSYTHTQYIYKPSIQS